MKKSAKNGCHNPKYLAEVSREYDVIAATAWRNLRIREEKAIQSFENPFALIFMRTAYISPRSPGRQRITWIPGQVQVEVEADWLVPVAPPTGSVAPRLDVSRRHEGPASQTAFTLHPNC